jgi:hypothetical protein
VNLRFVPRALCRHNVKRYNRSIERLHTFFGIGARGDSGRWESCQTQLAFFELHQDSLPSSLLRSCLFLFGILLHRFQLVFLSLDIFLLRHWSSLRLTSSCSRSDHSHRSVYTHSLQNRWPSLQASGSLARFRQSAQASKRRMDSFPNRCYGMKSKKYTLRQRKAHTRLVP